MGLSDKVLKILWSTQDRIAAAKQAATVQAMGVVSSAVSSKPSSGAYIRLEDEAVDESSDDSSENYRQMTDEEAERCATESLELRDLLRTQKEFLEKAKKSKRDIISDLVKEGVQDVATKSITSDPALMFASMAKALAKQAGLVGLHSLADKGTLIKRFQDQGLKRYVLLVETAELLLLQGRGCERPGAIKVSRPGAIGYFRSKVSLRDATEELAIELNAFVSQIDLVLSGDGPNGDYAPLLVGGRSDEP